MMKINSMKIYQTYRPTLLLNGAAERPPRTPPSATTDIAIEYKISWW